jgi:hypothetical protein
MYPIVSSIFRSPFHPFHLQAPCGSSSLTVLQLRSGAVEGRRWAFAKELLRWAKDVGAGSSTERFTKPKLHGLKTRTKNGKNGGIQHDLEPSGEGYPLVNIQKAMERSTIFNG